MLFQHQEDSAMRSKKHTCPVVQIQITNLFVYNHWRKNRYLLTQQQTSTTKISLWSKRKN